MKMTNAGLFSCAIMMVFLAGCGSTPLDKRWTNDKAPTLIPMPANGEEVPTLWVSSVPSDPGSRPKPKDLADHAAASYFTQLGKFAKSSDEFSKLAGKSIGAADSSVDNTSFDRTLVLTVSKNGWHPGDRLARLRIKLSPIDFKFSNYTIAASSYSTVNIDSLSIVRGATAGAEVDPTVGGFLAGSSKLTAGYSNQTTNAAQVSAQIEQLTVSFDNDDLILYRESEQGIDLTGTTLIKLTFRLKSPDDDSSVDHLLYVSDMKLFSDDAEPLTPAKASISFSDAALARPRDLFVKGSMEYVLRHIEKGADTYSETDDEVTFYSNPATPASPCYKVLSHEEMAQPRWMIETDQSAPLFINTQYGARQVIFFAYSDGTEFLNWINRSHPSAIGKQALQIADRENISQLKSLEPKSSAYPKFIIHRISDTQSTNSCK